MAMPVLLTVPIPPAALDPPPGPANPNIAPPIEPSVTAVCNHLRKVLSFAKNVFGSILGIVAGSASRSFRVFGVVEEFLFIFYLYYYSLVMIIECV